MKLLVAFEGDGETMWNEVGTIKEWAPTHLGRINVQNMNVPLKTHILIVDPTPYATRDLLWVQSSDPRMNPSAPIPRIPYWKVITETAPLRFRANLLQVIANEQLGSMENQDLIGLRLRTPGTEGNLQDGKRGI